MVEYAKRMASKPSEQGLQKDLETATLEEISKAGDPDEQFGHGAHQLVFSNQQLLVLQSCG